MNLRERFLEIMRNFNTEIRSIKWEFGYWGETINSWYEQGLPKRNSAVIPSEFTSPTASLYTKAWTCQNKFTYKNGVKSFPDGIAIVAGGLYWPTQGFPLDIDVKNYFNMDQTQRLVNVNLLFYPMFEPKTLEEDEKSLKYIDVDGVTRLFLKETATMPSGLEWPIKDEKSWKKIKEERVNFDNIKKRLPKNWDKLIKEYKNRDYPLALGGYPHGFFGTLAHLVGYDRLFYAYFDKAKLIHDMMKTFTELWIAVYSEVLADIDIDVVHIWEDISFGRGPMVSPNLIKEFMLPYYKRFTSFLKSRGIDIILVDTDGDCMEIIPLFIEGGATGIYPFEVNCGMDIVKVRKRFPKLQMLGGIPKSDIPLGREKIDEILQPVRNVLKTGGYIPFGDHLIPPEVRWDNFRYYRSKLNSIIDKSGK
jgi:uroporphyrinogen decarboxylase